METIKIAVEVNVNLSESTQKFIKGLFTTSVAAPVAVASKAPKKEVPAATVAPAAPAVETPKKEVPAAESSTSSKTIEDVRKALSLKVNDHREEIKNKLTELGAPSVTKLDPSKYDEMFNFLTSL